jgi:hypothetical protein
MAGGPVGGTVVFCDADLPVAHQHEVQRWARDTYQVKLDVIDSTALAEPDTCQIAVTYLQADSSLVPAPEALTLTAPQTDSFFTR